MAMQKPSLDIIQKLTVIFGFVGTIFVFSSSLMIDTHIKNRL